MTATTALNKQIERYRQMTGEQRLAVALDLPSSPARSLAKVFATRIPRPTPPKWSGCCITGWRLRAVDE